MKKILSVAALSAAMLLSSVSVANAAETKIGVYNHNYVLSSIPQIKAMEDKVKKAVGSKQKQAEKLNNELVALDKTLRDPNVASDVKAKAQRDFQLKKTELDVKVSEIREEQAKIVQKEEKVISEKITKAVETVAKAKGLTIVLQAHAVAHMTDTSLDISKEVVDIVSKSK